MAVIMDDSPRPVRAPLIDATNPASERRLAYQIRRPIENSGFLAETERFLGAAGESDGKDAPLQASLPA